MRRRAAKGILVGIRVTIAELVGRQEVDKSECGGKDDLQQYLLSS
jgi:hypothetical protein